jgi:predicted enzyme related to lactoylglutathione lyase
MESELALQAGGRIHKPKQSIGGNGFIAIIGDSEGNAIGLHSFA